MGRVQLKVLVFQAAFLSYFLEVSSMRANSEHYLLFTMHLLSLIWLELHNDVRFQLHLNQLADHFPVLFYT